MCPLCRHGWRNRGVCIASTVELSIIHARHPKVEAKQERKESNPLRTVLETAASPVGLAPMRLFALNMQRGATPSRLEWPLVQREWERSLSGHGPLLSGRLLIPLPA